MNKITSNAIEFQNVSKLFDDTNGIRNITFNVKKGEFHALIGANGAGKTTLVRTLLRLYQVYGGKIKIHGTNTEDSNALKKVGYISESPHFPREFSAKKYLFWAGMLVGKDKNTIRGNILDLSKKFKFEKLLNKNPSVFSSGQKQKLLLMKLLIEDSDVIILDEPTANLDPIAKITFFQEIERLNKKGKTIFISSHNLDEIESKISWVSIIKNGEIIFNNKKTNKTSLMKLFKTHVLETLANSNEDKNGKGSSDEN